MHATSLTESPPDFLHLVGHPLRWRLIGALARSDRMVHELTALVGEPQNLVSYHLGKLRSGRLVSSHRSSADRRDTYYGLDLARIGAKLTATGAALHPGLRMEPPAPGEGKGGPWRVLFLCTGNSARSQMAEALAGSLSGGAIEAQSAGSHPKPVHANAVRVMRDAFGLDLSGHTSKSLDVFAGETFDCVISLCDRVREACPILPGTVEAIHWSLPNPATGEPDEVTLPLFQETAADLEKRIGFLIALLNDRPPKKGDTNDRPA